MNAQWRIADKELLAQVKFGPGLHRDGSNAPGLIKVILQNYLTKEVLYGASMSEEAFRETMEKGLVVLYSKTEKGRWLKGETSGDKLRVVKIFLNCNCDQLLIQVIPLGQGVCHEKDAFDRARSTCFSKLLFRISNNYTQITEDCAMTKNLVLGIPSGSLHEATLALLKKIGIESWLMAVASVLR